MSVTVLSNVVLANRVIEAGGLRGKQIRHNSRISTTSGLESINVVWTQTLREYEFGFIPMPRTSWMQIEALHEVTEGGAYGFLMLDPKDSTAALTDGVVTELTSTTFQLYKRYTEAVSSRTKDRKITRPKTGIVVQISGVTKTLGVDYTLDADTGILTIAASPDPATVTWSGQFYVPVHFMEDSLEWELVAPAPSPDSRFIATRSCVLQEIRE
jgi:uncharacterized protein (TIGR02217 family)